MPVLGMMTVMMMVIFVGTGKTLVAAMIIKHMLLLNPARQVLFLVDRVLLVLQQSQNLRKQLGAALYPRYSELRFSFFFNVLYRKRENRKFEMFGRMNMFIRNLELTSQNVQTIFVT